jgi:UDP-GlcNAc3NAcA epimerase
MIKVIAVIGARPQFIKHAPIELSSKNSNLDIISIHTGQHYDEKMSQIFFDELKMKQPKYVLKTGGLGHGAQTGLMLSEIEPILMDEKPAAMLVYGDTNSTLAGALAASKLHIPVIHIEAGLRSFNKNMPEEINRKLTDHISDLLIAPTQNAIANLKAEGIKKNVFLTGDIMCDMIMIAQRQIKNQNTSQKKYYYSTIHRPYNTDDLNRLLSILSALNNLQFPVKLAAHPRTKNKLIANNIGLETFKNIDFLDPTSYFTNVEYMKNAQAIITDSGGMQKEAYILKKPCVTIRSETEWTETLQGGWNRLVFENLESTLADALQKTPTTYHQNIYGDGNAAKEIVTIIEKYLG